MDSKCLVVILCARVLHSQPGWLVVLLYMVSVVGRYSLLYSKLYSIQGVAAVFESMSVYSCLCAHQVVLTKHFFEDLSVCSCLCAGQVVLT